MYRVPSRRFGGARFAGEGGAAWKNCLIGYKSGLGGFGRWLAETGGAVGQAGDKVFCCGVTTDVVRDGRSV